MSETSSLRRQLGAVDPNIETNTARSPSKKAKTVTTDGRRILTFSVSNSPAQVQVLDTQTIYDLIDIICKETSIGDGDEQVNDHLWNVKLPNGKRYESSLQFAENLSAAIGEQSAPGAKTAKLKDIKLAPGKKLKLEYDYGTTSMYEITFVNAESLSAANFTDFPRRKPVPVAAGLEEFKTPTSIHLDTLFPNIREWTFREYGHASLNLFQPGRKKNFGLWDFNRHMIFLPAKPDNLDEYLGCLDFAAEFEMGEGSNWSSMVVIPSSSNQAERLMTKYGNHSSRGFVEAKLAPFSEDHGLNSVFPKVAALAGMRKDKKVPKGWITYSNKLLQICSGSAQVHQSDAPKNTAWDGFQQHKPASPNDVLRQQTVEIKSIHQLFCAVEALLLTL